MQEKIHMPALEPLRYETGFEVPEKDEAETTAGLIEAIHKINSTTFKDSDHAIRAAHAKSHGFLFGELKINEDLPDIYKQGMFAEAGTFKTVMRFSTAPGDILDDKVSTPRGLGLRIIGIPGLRLPGSEAHVTQDFLLVNGPAFMVSNAKKFLSNFKLLAATTDKAENLKKVLSATLQGLEKTIEAVGGESGVLKSLGGHPETHILGETFFTQAPVLFGDYMAKISVAPANADLQALKDRKVDLKDKPDGLRAAVNDFFASHSGVWNVQVQLCTDLKAMPIEDASVVWPVEQSPYVTVAQITIEPQTAWDAERAALVDDAMSFSPWHGIAAHRPLGSIMRVRKATYEDSVGFRAAHNGVTMTEPQGACPFHRT